ncbi:MAG: glycosyltransferase, partial [Actinobacteria bacterium]|nr:glycosyltransferase [Actinomycetota bacterium]
MSDWIYRVPEASTELMEVNPPTFSVVIAVYNAAEFIGDALDSCFAQTVAPLEILVVDDGSTDDLDSALAPYLEKIRLIRQPNGGESVAKNAGANAATGDYVLLLDADDVAHPQRIEAVESLAVKRPDLAIITHDDAMTQDGVLLRNYFGDDRIFVTVD